MSVFGKRMKKLRIEKDITLDIMSNKIGVAKSTLSRYENDKAQPTAPVLREIADCLDTSADYLLGRTNTREGEQIKYPSLPSNVQILLRETGVEYMEAVGKAREKGLTPKELEEIIDFFQKFKTDKNN